MTDKNSPGPSLVASIRQRQKDGLFPVISEVKVLSKKEGDLLGGRDPAELTRTMADCGAAGISVVTEPKYFGGSIDLLRTVVAAAAPLNLPVLQKDFVTREEQIEESAACGASAILLIAAMLDKDRLARLIDLAAEYGLETLVEAHSEEELKTIQELPGSLLGINNRDITVLEVDDGTVGRTEELSRLRKDARPLVSESSIASPDDVRRAGKSGADAVLVGTAILKAPDPADLLRQMITLGWPL